MKRYVLISLGIGLLVALVVVIFYFLQIFDPLTVRLNAVFEKLGFYPAGGKKVHRLVWAEILVAVATSFWICWCLADLSQTAQKVIVFITFLILILGISPTLALYGILFEPFSALSALLLGTGAATIFASSEYGNRKRTLEKILGRRISPKTFDELLESPKPPNFEGQSREVTVLTCRIFNRVELAETLPPAEFLRMTNLFRRVISGYLASQGACLDEAGPEIVRSFFGILKNEPNHAEKAVRAALALKTALKTLNHECQTRWSLELRAGVGINSGRVISGIYGAREHFFFSGVGPEVDFSRRLATANLQYGSDLLIGPQTFTLVREVAEVRPMEMFYDPETGQLTEIYQLLAMKEQFGVSEREMRDHYWSGIILFREGKYQEAIESFGKARIPGIEDAPLEFFMAKAHLKLGESRGGNNPKSQLTGEGHSRLLGNL